MKTPSLRRRAVVVSLAVLAAVLLLVGVFVDVALGGILRAEQRQRIESVATLATQLDGTLDAQDLADRLTIPGVTATIRTAGDVVVGVPKRPKKGDRPAPPAPPASATTPSAQIQQQGGQLVATQTLRDGAELTLTADTGTIDAALARFRLLMAVGSAAALGIAALLLRGLLGRALRPLDALARAARATAHGDRGRRLAPRDPTTDLGRAAAEFDAMLEDLEGAERATAAARERLSAFLSDASHELRTPLAGLAAGAERLLLDAGPDREAVATDLVRESRRAGRLVDDLLLVSRLEHLDLDLHPADLATLAAAAAGRAGRLPGAHPIAVVDERPHPSAILADPMRIEQILANLLQNAQRAAPSGSTRIRIGRATDGGSTVTVSDTGPGVAGEAREAIFERLVRLDPARSSTTGGAGLGLPIARGLAQAHGGDLVCVDPGPGDLPGAAFRLTLPATTEPTPAAATPPTPGARQQDRVPTAGSRSTGDLLTAPGPAVVLDAT
ncbi:sensor histidine kinase [uncultured Amnibacterium sp.]|uniref:sensor histidine kinase n=1 Tax=uncultured Amnibacterium sp. TaxID=1631851 RepID=UPI0035CB9E26